MFDLITPLYTARDGLFDYLGGLITDPVASFVTHPVPTFMWLALAGFVVISRNSHAR